MKIHLSNGESSLILDRIGRWPISVGQRSRRQAGPKRGKLPRLSAAVKKMAVTVSRHWYDAIS